MKNIVKCKIMCADFYTPYNTLLKKAGLLFLGLIISHVMFAHFNDASELTTGNPKDSVAEIAIHFPLNQARLLKTFSKNARSLNQLEDVLTQQYSTSDIDSIVIHGYASPEGSITNNLRLAQDRAMAVKAYIISKFPHISRNKIITRSQLVDWDAISAIIANDYSMPFRDDAEAVVAMQGISDIQKFRLLKSIGGGATLKYISRNYAVPLRRASGVMFYGKPKPQPAATPQEPVKTIEITKVDSVIIIIRDTVYREERPIIVQNYEQVKKPLFAVKTNLLFDLASALNVEVEVPIGQRWSVLGEYIFPWWLWESKQYCLQLLSANVEGRYWFGNRTDRPVLTGWFAGLYAGGGYYDLEFGNKGYQGEFYIAAGLSGGYAHTLGKNSNFRMEYSLGVGYLNTNYREYVPIFGVDDEWHLIRQRSGNYTWVGPTRVKVSLVWLLNYKSYKIKK